MTDAQLREILERHLPGPNIYPDDPDETDAEYCCTYCSHWFQTFGFGQQEPWPCDAYRMAEWLVNKRALPTAKQLADHLRDGQRRNRTYAELFPGG